MKRTIVLGLALLTLGSTAAAAFESTSRIDRRQDRQEWRIDRGIENGSLTKREAKRLRREAHQIERLEQMALRDRKLHKSEIGMLIDALNGLSEEIYEAKHNDRYRFSHRYEERKYKQHSKSRNGSHWHSKKSRHGPHDLLARRD